jgi:hypothetical protein
MIDMIEIIISFYHLYNTTTYMLNIYILTQICTK